ncbi:MAG: DUF3823 domain-containing protein [Tannerella sp.]|jgi:hypothetical protein|nr:DUF3823 domain-containing protein [Tannerella sp.]
MRHIYKIIGALSIGLLLLALSPACTPIDNYTAPSSRMSGKVIDKTSGGAFITGQNEFSIRLWETSWGENPTNQDIPVLQDGTYNNERLFDATYAMVPYGGPFWPVPTDSNIVLKKSLARDYELTPYLHVIEFSHQLNGTTLKLSCRLQAPITQNLPRVLDIRPFLSFTKFCSDGSNIGEYSQGIYQVNINTNWGDGVGDMSTGIGSTVYNLPDIPLKSARTYYVRVGVRVEDTYRKYNYSEIITVQVP